MKNFALAILLTLLASPAWATTYYLAPASAGGNDSNNGLSANTPWLTPNHAVNCGDVILAAASTAYSAWDFSNGKWGTVTCPAGNNVAWLKCATFDACKINVSGTQGMFVSASYWGVQGWEATVTGGIYFGCFVAAPPGTTSIHHIIFANDIANGCFGGGLQAYNVGNAGVDYFAVVGSIAYNSAQGSGECYSGISDAGPFNSDTLPGTHVYIAGNFSWNNSDPNPCGNMTPTDGEGIILDTFTLNGAVYTGQSVVTNNIVLSNGGRGIEAFLSPSANIYVYQNTAWGNNGDKNQTGVGCAEISFNQDSNVKAYSNIAATNGPTGCAGLTLYAYLVSGGNQTVSVYQNLGWSVSGFYSSITSNNGGFAYGSGNLFGTNPSFANAITPGAPGCGSATSVPNCMATVIANFTPTTTAAKAYGYQTPSASQIYDPLFPQWICNVNLPSGLVTMGCLSAALTPGAPTITNVIIQ